VTVPTQKETPMAIEYQPMKNEAQKEANPTVRLPLHITNQH